MKEISLFGCLRVDIPAFAGCTFTCLFADPVMTLCFCEHQVRLADYDLCQPVLLKNAYFIRILFTKYS